jgi:hypothetical protein
VEVVVLLVLLVLEVAEVLEGIGVPSQESHLVEELVLSLV